MSLSFDDAKKILLSSGKPGKLIRLENDNWGISWLQNEECVGLPEGHPLEVRVADRRRLASNISHVQRRKEQNVARRMTPEVEDTIETLFLGEFGSRRFADKQTAKESSEKPQKVPQTIPKIPVKACDGGGLGQIFQSFPKEKGGGATEPEATISRQTDGDKKKRITILDKSVSEESCTARISGTQDRSSDDQGWCISQGISNGPLIGNERLSANSNGYPLEKQVWARVGRYKKMIIRIPYVKEKFLDSARCSRFEKTRNPSRFEILVVARDLVDLIHQSGICSAELVLVPRRNATDMLREPMGRVAKAMENISSGKLKLNNLLARSKRMAAPSRTTIYEQTPDKDLGKVFSGVDETILFGNPRTISRFAGNSNFIERLDELGLGRNRSISEDYRTLSVRNVELGNDVIVLLDDSVGQGVSQIAAALAIHDAFPGAMVSPLVYWAFSNAPLKPTLSMSLDDQVEDLIQADEAQLSQALDAHYGMAQKFIDHAEAWARQAESIMRSDPLGNWLGGVFSGRSDFDQQKARQYLKKFIKDPRQLEIAVRLATARVDHSSRDYHMLRLAYMKEDPAMYKK